MSQHRQLSAILFTDIEGYTAIMQESEQAAMTLRHRHRQIIQEEHKNFNGRIIQYYGDGTLSTFQSIIEAVQCALSMQQQFLQAPTVPVRMGLHVGDIIFKEDDIIGDGVNLASRIESLGVSGSVLISDKANDELHNHPFLKTVSVGVYPLKNIKRSVEVFALNHEGLVIPKPNSLNGKTKHIESDASTQDKPHLHTAPAKTIPLKSVAVLPFVNIGNNIDQEYFSDGMAEEIINALTHLKDLKVAGRTSSFQFKNKDVDLRELGKKLGVCTVLSGSVRRQGNWLRITAQLINIEDGYQLWSEKYDREMDNVFAIQDDIALAITRKLKLTLLKKDHELITKCPTKNTEAYERYLKGRFYVTRRGAWIITALECFQQAVALDPEFALAYAAVADANLLIASYGLGQSRSMLAQAKHSAEKAIALDPSLSQPYCALGYYYACSEWNWAQAKENFLKSISLNPRYAEGHFRYAWNYLACVEGKFEEAEKHASAAIQHEPLSSLCYAMYAFILHGAGKFNEALNASKTGIELDANSFLCWVNMGVSQIALGQYEDAIFSFESVLRLSAKQIMPIHGLIWVYCLTGRKDQGYLLMNELKEKSKSEYVAPAFTAISAAYLNEVDEAFDYLEKAYAERDPALLVLKHARWVPLNLRKDSRFQSLLNRIGFGE
ncbi:MAG TPA: adenylate/guanylate cyclase domain-containing protein [Chryseolinea sp.]|nr:adenylate/guanylate cyclase domain-containing protein [Chryseolinea sp.]